MTTNSIALDFFNTWSLTGVVDRKFFTDDFIFEGPSHRVDSEMWLMNAEDEIPMENLTVLGSIFTETNAVLLFEGVDPVTALTFRTAWYFCLREGKICLITEVRQNIQSNFRSVIGTNRMA